MLFSMELSLFCKISLNAKIVHAEEALDTSKCHRRTSHAQTFQSFVIPHEITMKPLSTQQIKTSKSQQMVITAVLNLTI